MREEVAGSGRYSGVGQLLHWLIVGLLVVQFAVAWSMPDVGKDTRPEGLIAWHLSIGACILLVMLIRLGWRAASTVPPAPGDLSPPLRVLSRATHFLLYAMLIVLPVLGWINASARGWDVRLFGLIPLPGLAPLRSDWGVAAGDVHMALATVLLAVAGLHVLGALYHRFALRDQVLARMLPAGRGASQTR